MRVRIVQFTLALLTGALALVAMAPAASAHTADVTISCTAVTFNYAKFPDKANTIGSEVVTIDGITIVSKSFSFTGPTGSDTVELHFRTNNTYTVVGTATWTLRTKTKTATLTQDVSNCGPTCPHNPPPPCPHGHKPPCPHGHDPHGHCPHGHDPH